MKEEAQVVRLSLPGADSVRSADVLSFKNPWMTDNRIPLFATAPDLSTLVPGVEPRHIRISQSLCKSIPLTQCASVRVVGGSREVARSIAVCSVQ